MDYILLNYFRGGSFDVNEGSKIGTAYEEMPLTMGLAMVVILAVAIYVLTSRLEKILIKLVVLVCFFLFLSSAYFPYGYLMKHCYFIYHFIAKIQFPWRYLTIASILSTILFLFIIDYINCKWIVYGIIALCILQSSQYLAMVVNSKEGNIANMCEASLDSFGDAGNFVLEMNDFEVMKDSSIHISSEKVELSEKMRKGTYYVLDVVNNSKSYEYVDIPVVGYKNYQTNDKALSTSVGENGRLRVNIPPSYSGTFSVYYKEPFWWRMCEIISLIMWIMLLYWKRQHLSKLRFQL